MTLSADGMPLAAFLRYLSDQGGVSVVAEEGFDTAPVTIDARDQPVSAVLGAVARRLGVQLTRSGSLYFLGALRPEDRGVLVRKVTRLGGPELAQAVTVLLSEFGRATAYPDGLVVVGDRVEVLQRVTELLDSIESAPSESWAVQLHVVSITRSEASDLGLDVVPELEIAARFAAASGTLLTPGSPTGTGATLAGGLTAILRAERERRGVRMVADPLFVLVDGEEGTFRNGERVPVPRRTVSPEGTVTTLEFQYEQTGLDLRVTLRDLGAGRAMATVDVELSDIVGFIENAPRVRNQQFHTQAVLATGGVYLLGALRRDDENHGTLGVLGTRKTKADSEQVVQVWARAYRIGGPVLPPRKDDDDVASDPDRIPPGDASTAGGPDVHGER